MEFKIDRSITFEESLKMPKITVVVTQAHVDRARADNDETFCPITLAMEENGIERFGVGRKRILIDGYPEYCFVQQCLRFWMAQFESGNAFVPMTLTLDPIGHASACYDPYQEKTNDND